MIWSPTLLSNCNKLQQALSCKLHFRCIMYGLPIGNVFIKWKLLKKNWVRNRGFSFFKDTKLNQYPDLEFLGIGTEIRSEIFYFKNIWKKPVELGANQMLTASFDPRYQEPGLIFRAETRIRILFFFQNFKNQTWNWRFFIKLKELPNTDLYLHRWEHSVRKFT